MHSFKGHSNCMDNPEPEILNVEVVHLARSRQTTIELQVPPGSTAEEVIRLSGILIKHPELDLQSMRIGIFSRKISLDQLLKEGDRVEIYRPLLFNPKEIRRQRALK